MVVLSRPVGQMGIDLLQVGAQVRQFGDLGRVFRVPACSVTFRVFQCDVKGGNSLRHCYGLGAHAGQSFFACHHPVVQQYRMAHQKRRHAEPCGVAYAQLAPDGVIEFYRTVAAAPGGEVFDKVNSEGARQPDRQHLCLKRSAQLGALGYVGAVRRAEFAGTIDCGGPHQIADGFNLGQIGLLPGCQAFQHVVEQAHGAVGAAQGKFG